MLLTTSEILWIKIASLVISLLINATVGRGCLNFYYRRSQRGRCWWNQPTALIALTLFSSGFALLVLNNGLRIVLLTPILCLGPALLLIDAGLHKLPNLLTGALSGLSFLALLIYMWAASSFLKPGLALLIAVAFVMLLVPATFIRRGLGMGDIKLMAPLIALTCCWSWHALLRMICLTGLGLGIWAVFLLLTRRAKRYTHLAMGPWLLAGSYLALLFFR